MTVTVPGRGGEAVDSIGRYRLERRIGAGSFATVWLGHDDDLDVPVAVKVLAENWADNDDVRNRFLAEARILRRIRDPRLVQVYDIGTVRGRPALLRHGLHQRRLVQRPAQGRLRTRARAAPGRRGLPGHRGAARQRHHPPRRHPREPAAEHRPRRPDPGADRRPGRGEVDDRLGRRHDDGRYPFLHGAGAGGRRAAAGPPGGHLLTDRRDVRPAHRRSAVRHPQHRRHPGPRP